MSPSMLNRRSRGGCIDCRRSKVKCDEIRPFCGTCTRRRHVCQGYVNLKSRQKQQNQHDRVVQIEPKTPPIEQASLPNSDGSVISSAFAVRSTLLPSGLGRPTLADGTISISPPSAALDAFSPRIALLDNFKESRPTHSVSDSALDGENTTADADPHTRDFTKPPSAVSYSPWSLALIPPGAIHPADEPPIEVYFNRHPFELLIGSEFINEMNANVLVLLQHNPRAIADSLSAIGHLYMSGAHSNSIVPVLDRRARILANLRAMKDSSYDLEEVVALLLGLCAMEVSEPEAPRSITPPDSTLCQITGLGRACTKWY
jgi:hypothetical protein